MGKIKTACDSCPSRHTCNRSLYRYKPKAYTIVDSCPICRDTTFHKIRKIDGQMAYDSKCKICKTTYVMIIQEA